MAENLEPKITENMADLVDEIETKLSKLWEELIERNVIDMDDANYIKQSNKTNRDQARQLLHLICRRPVRDHPKFLEAFKITYQDKVLNILGYDVKDDKIVRMTKDQIQEFKMQQEQGKQDKPRNAEGERATSYKLNDKISANNAKLLGKINLQKLWDILIGKGVIDKSNVTYIKEQHDTERDRVRELLHWLCKRPPSDHYIFLQALQTTDQPEVLRILGYDMNLEPLKAAQSGDGEQPQCSSNADQPMTIDNAGDHPDPKKKKTEDGSGEPAPLPDTSSQNLTDNAKVEGRGKVGSGADSRSDTLPHVDWTKVKVP